MTQVMLSFRHPEENPSRRGESVDEKRGSAPQNRYTLLDGIRPLAAKPGAGNPKSPEMVSTHHAWRRLCASTGCEVTRRTFYNWISNGRLYSVRLGRTIFVPVSALETLIENCLRGESL